MATNGSKASSSSEEGGLWFDEVENIDSEWAAVRVLTVTGQRVRYRIPRRTYFEDIDKSLAESR